jgi:hypothetical protein
MFFDVFLPLLGVARMSSSTGPSARLKSMSVLWSWGGHDRILDERAVEHVQPALLGKGAGQPGAVYHGAQLDDGSLAGHGAGRPGCHCTLRALVIVVIGSWLFGCSMKCPAYLQLFAVFLLAMVALYGMGMMSLRCSCCSAGRPGTSPTWRRSRSTWSPGFFFPIKNLNFWVALSASLIPLTLGLDAMRQLVFSSG